MRNAKAIQTKSKTHTVRQINPRWFKVTSGHSGQVYDVSKGLNGASCSCQYGSRGKSQRTCSHIVAVFDHVEAQKNRTVSVWADEQQAARQRRPMVQVGDGLVLTSRVS